MNEFKPGDWVWYVKKTYDINGYNCHACRAYIKEHICKKSVARAQIDVITKQESIHGNNRTSYNLANAEEAVYATIVWSNDPGGGIFRTKEEAEAFLPGDLETTRISRDAEAYGGKEINEEV